MSRFYKNHIKRENGGNQWMWRVSLGRLKVAVIVYQHKYPVSPDRWVLQPMLAWDRKR